MMKKLLLYFSFLMLPIFSLAQALSGDYIIGSANTDVNFKTLTAAVAKITAVGVSGPTRFLLNDATINLNSSEAFPITINQFSGSNATNTLTIKPNVGKTVTITATNPNNYTVIPAIFKFDGADNIIIDGSNLEGGSTKNLILQNNCYITYALRAVVWIASNGTNGANNISVINTKIKMGFRSQGNTLTGIFSGGSTFPDFSTTEPTSGWATAANSNLTIRNNEFFNVRQAIVVRSSADAVKKSDNIQISLNTIGSTIEVEKPLMGIQVLNVKNSSIFDNTLNGLGRATVGGDPYLTGIDVVNSTSIRVQRNVIENITFNSNSLIVYGIRVAGSSSIVSVTENKLISIKTVENGRIHGIDISTPAASGILIANNFISGISSAGTTTNTGHGIYMENGGTSAKIYHNTVAMNVPQAGTSAAIYFAAGTGYDVRNNIFQNSSKAQTLNGEGPYAIYSAIQPNAFANLNYNNYYSPNIGFINAGPAGGHNDGGVKPTFAIWQAAINNGAATYTKDQHSKNVNPLFVSSTDLHLQAVAGNAALDNAGTPITAVPKDIDGQTRSTSTPDMGADEFSANPIAIPTTPATSLTASTFTPTGLTLNWTNGNGTNRLVVVRAANAVSAAPVDRTSYTANSTFGTGSQLGIGNYVGYSGSGNSVSISGLSACNTYKIAVYEFNGSGITAKYLSTNPATSTVGESTTFANGVWTKGKPNYLTGAIISSNLTLTESLIACKLTVTGTSQVIVPATFDVTLNGALTVETTASFTLENNANLIQTSDVANTGNIVVKRNSSALKRQDYTLWSSPTTGSQTLLDFSPKTLTNRFYTYKTVTNLYAVVAPSATEFAKATGYLIRLPNTHPITPTIWDQGAFTGTPNNGPISFTMVNDGAGLRFNLVGNPYPSPISATTFADVNKNSITGALYFWRKTNDPKEPSYFTWTTLGISGTTNVSVADPKGIIQTGQGFFVEAKNNEKNIQFNNAMRTNDHVDQFFRTSGPTEYNRIWLTASNEEGARSQTLVGYFSQGEDGLDASDGRYINDGDIAFTSLIGNVPYAIQGKALPFSSTDVVPMYLKVKNAGTYTIAIDDVDGLFEGNQDIFLRDNMVGVTHDLKESAYTFNTVAGHFNGRFEMVYTRGTLVVDNSAMNANTVTLYKKENNVVINSGKAILDQVEVFDMTGRLVASAQKINSNQVSIDVGQTTQVLLVKITSTDGTIVSKKTIN